VEKKNMSIFTPLSALGCAAGGTARILRQGYSVLFFVLAGVGQLLAQAAPPAPAFQSRMEEAARTLANEPRLKRLSAQQRQALSEFVVGNMLFVMAHEIGHAVMGEMEIPVLGREEDAADAFAILNALKVGHNFSHGVLVEAAKGWFLSDRRDKKEANQLTYYDNHGLNLQRAYQIVCLMVGSDSKRFKDLADETKLPKERQQSCQEDYRIASWSWETILKSHRRAADQPKQTIDVKYGMERAPWLFTRQCFALSNSWKLLVHMQASDLLGQGHSCLRCEAVEKPTPAGVVKLANSNCASSWPRNSRSSIATTGRPARLPKPKNKC
jgi:hypothetical protein